jgi:hypothetical protein
MVASSQRLACFLDDGLCGALVAGETSFGVVLLNGVHCFGVSNAVGDGQGVRRGTGHVVGQHPDDLDDGFAHEVHDKTISPQHAVSAVARRPSVIAIALIR